MYITILIYYLLIFISHESDEIQQHINIHTNTHTNTLIMILILFRCAPGERG